LATGFTLQNGGTTIRFALAGINTEGTLSASIAAGALADANGNPNVAFSGNYNLDIGTVPFPTEAARPVRFLRHMTTQLLQEAAQVIPNQQLLINVVSKRVRQLGLGHRPLVETTPRMSLTDIALKEIIAGKLTYESLEGSADGA